MGIAVSAALVRASLRPPPPLDERYVSHDQAAQQVVDDLVRFLKTRRGRTRIALLEEDAFDHRALPEWQPEEISGKLCTAVSRAGLKQVSFTAGKDTAARTVEFLKRFDSAIYAESFLDKLGKAQQPDLRLTCKVVRLSASSDQAQLACSLLDLAGQVNLSPVARDFTRPDYVKRVAQDLEAYAAARTRLQSAVLLGGALGAVSGALALCLGVFFLYKRGQYLDRMPHAVAQLEQLIKQQSYHTAQEQLERCLEYLPEEASLGSLKDRLTAVLGDYGGDPFLAERVALKVRWVEAEFDAGRIPSPEELAQLAALPGGPAQKLLAQVMAKDTQVKQLDSDKNREQQHAQAVQRNLEYLRGLIDLGKLDAAYSETQAAYRVHPVAEISAILSEIETRQKRAEDVWAALRHRLARGNTSDARETVADILRSNAGHPHAKRLASCLQTTAVSARLVPQGVGRPIALLREPSFIVGRDPSRGAALIVPDDTVGRSHARFTVLEDVLVVEDLNSKNGTVVDGRKVQKAEVADGDMVRLGPASVFETYLCRGDEVSAASSETRLATEAGAAAGALTETRRIGGVLLDHPKALALWGRMPVSFSAAGLAPDKRSSLELSYRDGILLYGAPGAYELVLPGDVVEQKGVRYTFETA
jgi:hypothetical protein